MQEKNIFAPELPAKPQKIFLVRHAKPELPYGGRIYYGRTDFPLAEEGVDRARRLALELNGIEFDAVYSSDLIRARHTAELIAGGENKIVATPDLREIDMGEWEGVSVDDVRDKWEEIYERRGAAFAETAPPGGESFVELQARSVPAVLKILHEAPSGNVLIVAHAAFIWTVMCKFFKFDLNDLFSFAMDYCGTHILHSEGGYIRLIRYNWNASVTESRFW